MLFIDDRLREREIIVKHGSIIITTRLYIPVNLGTLFDPKGSTGTTRAYVIATYRTQYHQIDTAENTKFNHVKLSSYDIP